MNETRVNSEAEAAPDVIADAELEAGQHGWSIQVEIAPEQAGARLDVALAAACDGLSRSRIQGLIREGAVAGFDDEAVYDNPKRKVSEGERFVVSLPEPVAAQPAAEDLPLSVIYEDDQLIVIDKPAGVVVHPSAGHDSGTLVNALIHHCGNSLSGIGGVRRPGIVHRLDKDTTGLLVVAKTDAAHAGLSEQFAAHGSDGRMHRIYEALVWGEPLRPKGRVDAPLGRHPAHRTRMAVVAEEKGRRAVTHYNRVETLAFGSDDGKGSPTRPEPVAHGGQAAVLDQGLRLSMMRLELETGRTHQIRVHLAHLGHPVVGDPVYGAGFRSRSRVFPERVRHLLDRTRRQMLHAGELGFEHPVTGQVLSFSSPLPADFSRLLQALRSETQKS